MLNSNRNEHLILYCIIAKGKLQYATITSACTKACWNLQNVNCDKSAMLDWLREPEQAVKSLFCRFEALGFL